MKNILELELLKLIGQPQSSLIKLLGMPTTRVPNSTSISYFYDEDGEQIIGTFIGNKLKDFQTIRFFTSPAGYQSALNKLRFILRKEGFQPASDINKLKFKKEKRTTELSWAKDTSNYRVVVKGY